ncbi:MAG TPA: DUF3592 domain-containing protein, partial [Nitrospira sp.]|nr:DUF3592 domain-containing protein [Nitrospira sp.]
ICICGWLGRQQWLMISRWPRVNATVLSKDISTVGARLMFTYQLRGRRQYGVGFRWGSKQEVQDSLQTYKPGSIQAISYDPQDPSQVNTYLTWSWMAFRGIAYFAAFGVLFVVGGRAVWKWAGGWHMVR